MTTYTEQELIAAAQAGYHVLDDLPLATRSWLEGYRAGRSTPQPVVDVNQQLLEALQKAESHLVAMMAHIEHKPQRFQDHCWQQVLDIRGALLSTGKENNNE